MSDCTCVHSEWNKDRTTIINSFELDPACPIHGDEAFANLPLPVTVGSNRWAAFTDDEMEMLASERQSTDRAFEAEILAECMRRVEQRDERPGRP